MKQWEQFRTESAAKQFTRSQFNELLAREQSMIDEPLFSDVLTGIPETWRTNEGFECFMADCPHCFLSSPIWRLVKSNPRLPLLAANVVTVLHQKYQPTLVADVRSVVNESRTAKEAIQALNKHSVPCPAGNWTPDSLKDFCRVNNIKKQTLNFYGDAVR